jgi:hypothetical protein
VTGEGIDALKKAMWEAVQAVQPEGSEPEK